jgi:hypothetical protein
MNVVYAQLHAGYSNDASKYLVGSSSSQAQKHFNQRFLVQIPDDDFAHFFSIVARMVELCVRTPRRNKLAGKKAKNRTASRAKGLLRFLVKSWVGSNGVYGPRSFVFERENGSSHVCSRSNTSTCRSPSGQKLMLSGGSNHRSFRQKEHVYTTSAQ